jgi:hypothetical protein
MPRSCSKETNLSLRHEFLFWVSLTSTLVGPKNLKKKRFSWGIVEILFLWGLDKMYIRNMN